MTYKPPPPKRHYWIKTTVAYWDRTWRLLAKINRCSEDFYSQVENLCNLKDIVEREKIHEENADHNLKAKCLAQIRYSLKALGLTVVDHDKAKGADTEGQTEEEKMAAYAEEQERGAHAEN